MAITTYSELQTAINNWSERSDAAGQVKEFIALAERRLNREIGAVETNATLTGVVDSRTIDISALSMERPIALWVVETSGDETPLQLQAEGTFAYLDDTGLPEMASFNGSNLVFNRPVDQAYSFRFRYRQKFALSDAATTNWLLDNHHDIYLAASMMWGAGYRQDLPMGAAWKTLLDEGIPEVCHQIAAAKRGVLRVDPSLAAIGRRCSR